MIVMTREGLIDTYRDEVGRGTTHILVGIYDLSAIVDSGSTGTGSIGLHDSFFVSFWVIEVLLLILALIYLIYDIITQQSTIIEAISCYTRVIRRFVRENNCRRFFLGNYSTSTTSSSRLLFDGRVLFNSTWSSSQRHEAVKILTQRSH